MFPLTLYFHPDGDDWSFRSYSTFGLMASLDAAMVVMEARKDAKGVFFLLNPACKPFWQRDASGLNCTVCVDSEHYAKPVGYIRKNAWDPTPCEAYRPCEVPRGDVDKKLVYEVGLSIDLLRNQTCTIWRERSHDW